MPLAHTVHPAFARSAFSRAHNRTLSAMPWVFSARMRMEVILWTAATMQAQKSKILVRRYGSWRPVLVIPQCPSMTLTVPAELQGALDRVTPKSSSPRASSTLPDSSGITWVTQVASGTPGFPNVEPSSTVPPLSTAGGSIDTLLMNDISAVSGPSTSFIMGGLEEAPDDPSDPPRADFEAGKVGGPFLDIFWPGWPPRLPTPAMLDHL